MKKLLLLAIPAMLMSCGQQAKEYAINGTASEEFEGKQVLLRNEDNEAIDTCVVAEGVFTFAGSVEDQTMYIVEVERTKVPVFMENGAVIAVDLSAAPASVKDNGGMNDIYSAFTTEVTNAQTAIGEKVKALSEQGLQWPQISDSLQADMDAIKALFTKCIDANKDNYVGAQVLGSVSHELYRTIEEMDSVMAVVKYAKEIKAVNSHYNSLKAIEATKEGKMFVDFEGQDTEGKTVKLSDYVGKGKYVLVDFWASWCGPCKMEIPNLVELHKKFNGEKFTVLGVNVWDQEAKFKEALEAEGINYPQIYVPTDSEVNATELYGIQGIPQIMLFGPDGTILKRDLRGEEMKVYVESQLK